jgi:hypothetical protein
MLPGFNMRAASQSLAPGVATEAPPRSPRIRLALGPAAASQPLRVIAPHGQVGRLDWSSDDEPVDGGVPGWARRLLARVLTELGPAAFFATETVPGRVASRTPLPRSWLDLALAGRWPAGAALVASDDCLTLEAAFDDAGFSWDLEAQAILLLGQAEVPTDRARTCLEGWMRCRQARVSELALPAGALGLLLPGSDGHYADLAMSSTVSFMRLCRAFAVACAGSGVAFSFSDTRGVAR